MSLRVGKAAERIQLGPEAAGPGASPRSSAASIYRLVGYALCKRHSRYAVMRMLAVEEFCPTPEIHGQPGSALTPVTLRVGSDP
jgi:hypothetical protein